VQVKNLCWNYLKNNFMLTTQKQQSDFMAYWFTVLLVFILFGRFGLEAIQWVLMKLYEFFIQHVPLKI
jgi:hypothetical protein